MTTEKKDPNLPLPPDKARRERRAIKEELLLLLGLPVDDLSDATWQQTMLLGLLKKAAAGDVSAAAFIRDTIGEKPTDKPQHSDVSAKVQVYKIPDNGRG